MNQIISEDMHVHSTFSDGKHSLEENIQQAMAVGINQICCVDHVRKDTDWIPAFTKEIARLRKLYRIKIYAGVETKLLNESGDLDLPFDTAGIDYLYVADHQFPVGNLVFTPAEIRTQLAQKTATPERLIESLTLATINAMQKYSTVVLAHLFSILPKVGLQEDDVDSRLLHTIVTVARQTGACVEVDERWKCPSLRTMRKFQAAGVKIFFSTDSHRKEKIGQYQYNQTMVEELSVPQLWHTAHNNQAGCL